MATLELSGGTDGSDRVYPALPGAAPWRGASPRGERYGAHIPGLVPYRPGAAATASAAADSPPARRTADRVTILAAAHHEAGHAVCALALGGSVQYLRVLPDGNGETRFSSAFASPRNRAEAERLVAAWLAGAIAERRHLDAAGQSHRWNPLCAERDIVNASAELEDYVGDVPAALARLGRQAGDILDANRAALRVIAEASAARGDLGGDEVERIYRGSATTAGPIPPKPAPRRGNLLGGIVLG
jgi:hypothetical protein